MKRSTILIKAILFAFCIPLFLVGTTVEATNSALIVNVVDYEAYAGIPENNEELSAFVARLRVDGWRRYRIPDGRVPTYENVVAAINNYVETIENDSVAVIAFRGYVVEKDGSVYFLPANAKKTDVSSDGTNAIRLKDVVSKLENTPAKRCVVIVDNSNVLPYNASDRLKERKESADDSVQRHASSKVSFICGSPSEVFDKINFDDALLQGKNEQGFFSIAEVDFRDDVAENQIE